MTPSEIKKLLELLTELQETDKALYDGLKSLKDLHQDKIQKLEARVQELENEHVHH